MRVLGIETSCDETALALVDVSPAGACLRHEVLASQAPVHALFGGVVPEIASREHLRRLPQLFRELQEAAGVAPGTIQAVAVARGPGLLGALLTGVSFAKGVALGLGAPLVGVNHLEAHLLAVELEQAIPLPALGVLVSGGHTELVRIEAGEGAYPNFTIIGCTLDDAAGEAFDKCAKALNLPYPGGACLDAMAQIGGSVEPGREIFSPPYVDNDNLDFSFSGLKTAAVNAIAKYPELMRRALCTYDEALEAARSEPALAAFCASFNHAVAKALAIKAERALGQAQDVQSVVLAGGVAANTMVREALHAVAARAELQFLVPPPALCTDNAAMIALTGGRLALAGRRHGAGLEAIPRGQAIPQDFVNEF